MPTPAPAPTLINRPGKYICALTLIKYTRSTPTTTPPPALAPRATMNPQSMLILSGDIPIAASCRPQIDLSIVLFNHQSQQLRNAVRRHIGVLAGLRAEAVVPILG